MSCAKCDMCGSDFPAELSCTVVPGEKEGEVEKACWCVCPACKDKFEQEVRAPLEGELGAG